MENEDEERGSSIIPRRFIVASGGYETQIRIHDQDANLVRTLQFPDVQVLHLAFSGQRSSKVDDRLLLAVGGSPKIGVYDISPHSLSPTPFYLYDMHTAAITCVGFEPSASEFLYSSSEDGTLQVWVPVSRNSNLNSAVQQDANNNNSGSSSTSNTRQPPRNTLRTYFNRGNISSSNLIPINDTAFHPEKMLYFTVDSLGRLRIWDHNDKKGEGLINSVVPHKTQRHLQCIDISSDFSIVAMANLDGLVFIYNVDDCLNNKLNSSSSTTTTTTNTIPIPAIIRPSDSYVTRVRLSVSMNLLACPLTSGIKVFRMRDINTKNTTTAANINNNINSSSNEEEAYHSNSNSIGEVQDVAPMQEFGDRPGWIWDAAFVGDSEDCLITCSSNTSVRLWDLKCLSKSRDFPASRKAVVCLAVKEFLPDTITNPTTSPRRDPRLAEQQHFENVDNELHQPQPQQQNINNQVNHGGPP